MAPSRAVTRSPSSDHNALQTIWRSYRETPARLQLCDAFLVFHMLAGMLLFIYVFLAPYPFNAFLAACVSLPTFLNLTEGYMFAYSFASNVGQFVLVASLRMQVNTANQAEFKGTSPERAFAEFCFASVVLQAFVTNYLG